MAIRRISELDQLQLSAYVTDDGHLANGKALTDLVFETSEWQGQTPEVNSYYLSRKLNGAQLSAIFMAALQVDKIWDAIYYISSQIGGNDFGLCAWNVINDWKNNGMPGNTEYFPANISCTNLTVQNDIHGCATSARWN